MPAPTNNAPRLSPEELKQRQDRAYQDFYANNKTQEDASNRIFLIEHHLKEIRKDSPEYAKGEEDVIALRAKLDSAATDEWKIDSGLKGVDNTEDRAAIRAMHDKARADARRQAAEDLRADPEYGEHGTAVAHYRAAKPESFDRSAIRSEYNAVAKAEADVDTAHDVLYDARQDFTYHYMETHQGQYPDEAQVAAATTKQKAAYDAAISKGGAAYRALDKKLDETHASWMESWTVNDELGSKAYANYPLAPAQNTDDTPGTQAQSAAQPAHVYKPRTVKEYGTAMDDIDRQMTKAARDLKQDMQEADIAARHQGDLGDATKARVASAEANLKKIKELEAERDQLLADAKQNADTVQANGDVDQANNIKRWAGRFKGEVGSTITSGDLTNKLTKLVTDYPELAPPPEAPAAPAPNAASGMQGTQAPGLLGGAKPNERATAEGQSNHAYTPAAAAPAKPSTAALLREVANDPAAVARLRGKTPPKVGAEKVGSAGEVAVATMVIADNASDLLSRIDEYHKAWYAGDWKKDPQTAADAMRMYASASRERENGNAEKMGVPDGRADELLRRFKTLYAAQIAKDTAGMSAEQREAYLKDQQEKIEDAYEQGWISVDFEVADLLNQHPSQNKKTNTGLPEAIQNTVEDSWDKVPLPVVVSPEEQHYADDTLDAMLHGDSTQHQPEHDARDEARDAGREQAIAAINDLVFHSRDLRGAFPNTENSASNEAGFAQIADLIKNSKQSPAEMNAIFIQKFHEGWTAMQNAVQHDKNLTEDQRNKFLKALGPDKEKEALDKFMTAIDMIRNPAEAEALAMAEARQSSTTATTQNTHTAVDVGVHRKVGGVVYENVGGHIWRDGDHYYYSVDDSVGDKKIPVRPDGNGNYSHLNGDGRTTYYRTDGTAPTTTFGNDKVNPNTVKQFLGGISDAGGTTGQASSQVAYDPNGPALPLPPKAKGTDIGLGGKITLT